MDIIDYLRPEQIALNIEAGSKASAIEATARLLLGVAEVENFEGFVGEVFAREGLGSTAMGYGIAIPHARSRHVEDIVVAVGRVVSPIMFDEDLGRDVRLIFLLGTPHRAVSDYLKLVAGLARRVKQASVVECLMRAEDPGAFVDCLRGGGRG